MIGLISKPIVESTRMNHVIQQTIQDFSLDLYRPIFPRELDLGEPLQPRAGNLVTVITGMRRSGKSYRLFQQMDELHHSGIPYSRMLYFNFEDDRLTPVTPQTGDEVLEAFYSLHPENLDDGAYLFLDELQEMSDWGSWMRRIVDTRKVTVFATGSSSRMLSSDIATAFRGRSIAMEQLPLSFREYSCWHLPEVDVSQAVHPTKDSLLLRQAFASYLMDGGFPAAQDLARPRAILLLQSYAQQVVARDVIERNNVSNPRVASLFAQMVLGSNGRSLSLRKAENQLRSQGLPASRALLSEMLRWLEDAFLIGRVRELSRTAAEANNGIVKLYAIDPGLAAANAPASVRDEGQRLEDAVYLELLRRMQTSRQTSVSYLKTRGHAYEVDFVVGDALFGTTEALYQVTQSLSEPKTRNRELRALCEAMGELGVDEGTVIVEEGKPEEVTAPQGVIHCVPAWQWFLQPET